MLGLLTRESFLTCYFVHLVVGFVSVDGLQQDGVLCLRRALHLHHDVVFGRLLFGSADIKQRGFFIWHFAKTAEGQNYLRENCGYMFLAPRRNDLKSFNVGL